MKIAGKTIARDGPPLLLAEIGVNHDGDVRVAAQLVDAAAAAGADGVKFQLFDADLLLSADAGLVEYQKNAADDPHAMLRALQLSPAQLAPLVAQAHRQKLAAVVTPFALELVPACVAIGVDAIKLASPDLVNQPLIEAAVHTGLPLILSTGAADMAEVQQAVGWLDAARARTAILQCVSSYPTPIERAHFGGITALRGALPEMAIGYSDHTTETYAAALAVTAGACLLEKHLTLDRARRGPDHAASMEPRTLAEYVSCARQAFASRGAFAKAPQDIELECRAQTRQSVVALRDLPAGTVLTRDVLTVKRPGTGIPARDLATVVGRTLARRVQANHVLRQEDLRG